MGKKEFAGEKMQRAKELNKIIFRLKRDIQGMIEYRTDQWHDQKEGRALSIFENSEH